METEFERMLMNSYKAEMIQQVAAHPVYFEEALDLAITDRQPYAWRSAWLLWSCMEPGDPRVKGHMKKLVKALPGKSDGHKRELLKILLLMELPSTLEGRVFSECMGLWEKVKNKPSLRHVALRMLMKIIKRHPGLKKEMVPLVGPPYLDYLSGAARKSVKKIFHQA